MNAVAKTVRSDKAPPASTGRIIQCFMDADLRGGHDWLADMARTHKINVKSLQPGEFVVFVNRAQDKIKMYASHNIVAYMKLEGGRRVTFDLICEIPRAFNANGRLDANKAMRDAAEKVFRPRRQPTATVLEFAQRAKV